MANAEFWRKMAAEFRALPNDHGMFRIDWHVTNSRLTISPLATDATLVLFESACRRAGFALNPQSNDFILTWLEGLKVRTTWLPGAIKGSIPNPCEFSAEVCDSLEAHEIQIARPRPRRMIESGTRTLLPQSALEEIRHAHRTADYIRDEAEEVIASNDLDDHSKRARSLRSTANFKAAQAVLRVAAKGYTALGLSPDDLHRCIKDEIEGAVNSLELNQPQLRLLEHELIHGATPSGEKKGAKDAPTKAVVKAVEIENAEPSERRASITRFLQACNAISKTKIYKRHIWLAVGHTKARQFEHWQAKDPRVTEADNRNFPRILSTTPQAFIDSLRKKGILPE